VYARRSAFCADIFLNLPYFIQRYVKDLAIVILNHEEITGHTADLFMHQPSVDAYSVINMDNIIVRLKIVQACGVDLLLRLLYLLFDCAEYILISNNGNLPSGVYETAADLFAVESYAVRRKLEE